MTQANDSLQVAPGASGPLVATHLINGKEYQVVMVAAPDGHIEGSNPIHRLLIPSSAVGASKNFFDLFNAAGSGKVIKILAIFAYPDIDTAVTGVVGVQLDLFRTTAVGTGGTAATNNGTVSTAATISEMDSANADPPVQITARLAPTGGATAGAWLATRWVFTEETNAAAAFAAAVGVEFIRNEGAKLMLREGEGMKIQQGSVASVGSIAFEVTFELI